MQQSMYNVIKCYCCQGWPGKKIQPAKFKATCFILLLRYRAFAIWEFTNVLLLGVYLNYDLIFFFWIKDVEALLN